MKIAVDFDGTCVDHSYPDTGADVPYAVLVLTRLVKAGHRIILYTMRHGDTLEYAIAWFNRHGIPLYGINTDPDQHSWTTSSKAYAEAYIDDLAIGCPLISVSGFKRQCVDWLAIESLITNSKNHGIEKDDEARINKLDEMCKPHARMDYV